MTRAVPDVATSAGDPYVPRSGNGGYLVRRYDLDLTYRMSSNRLAGRALITAVSTQDLDRLSLDLSGLSVSRASVNGARVKRFATRAGKLQLTLGTTVPAGSDLVIDIAYGGNPTPVRSHWGEVGWEELDNGVIVAGQPDGAPSWFPCNDHPSNKAAYRISVTTDSPYRVVANGRLVSQHSRASQTTWVYDQPEPMATYLATVQIGQYELQDLATRPVRQRGVHARSLRARFEHDFGRQTQMMELFVQRFGPYPFAEYSVVVTDDELEIPLEAQGLSVFGSNHLDGERGYERLIAHELAHQWFGNSLTVRRWQHIWLNEGFACYAEWLWSEDSGGPSAKRLAERYHERLRELPQDLVIADPGPELMFDDRLYKRGALTLHALRTMTGDKAFFGLLREWTAAHRHGSVETADFVEHCRGYCGDDVDAFVRAWLFEPSLPALPGGRSRR